jgi:hypothetical protein
MSELPSTHGADGRAGNGRFASGNQFGGGNPLAGRAAKIRAVLLERLTPETAGRIADRLIAMAERGDLAAIKELLDRTAGRVISSEVGERLDAIEETLRERSNTP